MDKTEIIEKIKTEIRASFEAITDMIENGEPAVSSEMLRQTELKIVEKTDKIAGKCTEAILSIALNNEEVINESKKLVKSCPKRMKNHGKRDVVIHPYRGGPFSIKATYHCRAGLSPNKSKKKGEGSILS